MDATEKLAIGRAIARKWCPYFYQALLSLVPVEVQTPNTTMGVTQGLVLYYNREFVLSLTDRDLAFVLLHETNHVIRNHHNRVPEGNPYLRNLAADIPINDDLYELHSTSMPLVRAKNFGFPKNQTMEVYYKLLCELENPPSENGICMGRCGGLAGNSGDEATAALESALDTKYGRPSIDRVIAQHASLLELEKSNCIGMYGGDLKEVLSTVLAPPKVSWRRELSYALLSNLSEIKAGCEDYSIIKPSRRAFCRRDKVIRPGLIAHKPSIVICLDTSLSMDKPELQDACNEIANVVRLFGSSSITLLQADTEVTAAHRNLKLGDLRNITIVGRGGTNFDAAIHYAKKLNPQVLIYLTDGFGIISECIKPPKFKTIWCIIGHGYSSIMPWGKTIFAR